MTVKTFGGNEIDDVKIISAGYSVIKNFGVPISEAEKDKNFYVNDVTVWINTDDGTNYIIEKFNAEDDAKLYLLDFIKNFRECEKC